MLLVIQHAMNAPVVLLMKSKVLLHALPFLLDHIFGMNKFENANPDLFVLVKRSIKLHVHQGRTQTIKDRYRALNVQQANRRKVVVAQYVKPVR